MNQVSEFFKQLLDTSDWPPRWHCGTWSDFHGWLYIFSDLAIWLAYFIIPVIIIWYIQKKHNVPFLPVFWLFGAFIILCGSTHLLDAVIFWWPAYRLSGFLRFLTAIVSFITVFAVIRDLPKALSLQDTIEDNPENEKLKIEVTKQKIIIEELEQELAKLRNLND